MLCLGKSILGFELANVRGLILLACVLAMASTANADDLAKRAAFAQQLTKDIVQSASRKIYLPDFTDTSGKQVVLGRFFAATFSDLLSEEAQEFTVISRIDVHSYLIKGGWTDHDLSTADGRGRLESDFGADAILWGTVSVIQGIATIDLIGRTPSGKELFQRQYQEKLDSVLREDFEAGQSGDDFYFAGLDGVTIPQCSYCPTPEYPVGQGSPAQEGQVVLLVLVTAEGKADQVHLVEKLEPTFDRAAIDGVRSWRFTPAKDPDGRLVPVRMPVEVTFKRRWQAH